MGCLQMVEDDQTRDLVLELLKAHGTHATSFQILEQGFSYWFDEDKRAVVAYVEASGWWVAAASPLAPEGLVGVVAARFVEVARQRKHRVAFFSVDDDFIHSLEAAVGSDGFDAIKIGEQPEWDPGAYHTDGPKRRGLRSQVRRASNKGVRVRRVSAREVAEAPGPLRAQIEGVLARWLADRKMSAMRFMVDLQPFSYPDQRRYYVAEQGDRAVGFLAAVPVYRRRGWFFEDMIRTPGAPNGTVELLIDAAMRDAGSNADAYVTLGLAPLSGIDTQPGRHIWLRRALFWCDVNLGSLYRFAGLRSFKARFHPDRWVTQWLVVSPGSVGPSAFHAVLLAFAGGGLLSFGADTLLRLLRRLPLRHWSWALVAFALFLVPWTVLLAMADGAHWFGDVSIQRAWVAFDSAMVCALMALALLVRRGQALAQPMSVFLAGATLTDFLLTTVQAMHLHREPSHWSALFIAMGMAGPLLATIFLGTLMLRLQGSAAREARSVPWRRPDSR